jgi:hypothetical protein
MTRFEEDPGKVNAVHIFGPSFVEEVIQALGELDAEHLAALTKTAESFMNDFAPSLSPAEAAEMEAKMQLFSAVLNETRRNLRLFVLTSGQPAEFGYKPGRTRWVD